MPDSLYLYRVRDLETLRAIVRAHEAELEHAKANDGDEVRTAKNRRRTGRLGESKQISVQSRLTKLAT